LKSFVSLKIISQSVNPLIKLLSLQYQLTNNFILQKTYQYATTIKFSEGLRTWKHWFRY